MTPSKVLEAEKKVKLLSPLHEFIDSICREGFSLIDRLEEEDIYFSDVQGTYIRDRTCLRIRTTIKSNNSFIELTYKGPSSDSNSGSYVKLEENLEIDGDENKKTEIQRLREEGFFVYSIVNKKRQQYQRNRGEIVQNILIDAIDGEGEYVEFELLYYGNDEETKNEIEYRLDTLIGYFRKSFDFDEVILPYRDIVAKGIYLKFFGDVTSFQIPRDLRKQIDKRLLERFDLNNYSPEGEKGKFTLNQELFDLFQYAEQPVMLSLYGK